jgi:hypothetical protein
VAAPKTTIAKQPKQVISSSIITIIVTTKPNVVFMNYFEAIVIVRETNY